MILTAATFAGLLLLTIAPGLVLCGTQRRDIGTLAAIAAASMVVAMLTTALIGIGCHALFGFGLPAIALAPVSLALLAGALLIARPLRLGWPRIEWQALAAAALFLGYGVAAYWMAFDHAADGSLRVHAWYNADWFKHIGHVNGIANFGVPARDMFGGGGPLHYYWLCYVLPGAATAIGGDAWTALYLANLVYAGLMALTFYGLVRASGATPTLSAIAMLLATIVTGRMEAWPFLFMPGGIETFLGSPIAPPEPALASLALYIPQHALALCLLMGWALIALTGEDRSLRARWLTLAALAAVMTISTLFGAMLLAIYGIVQIARRRLAAVPELALVAIGSILLVVALGVFNLSDPTSAVSARIGGAAAGPQPAVFDLASNWVRSLLVALGIPLLAALYALFKLNPATDAQRDLRLLCAIMIAVPFLFLPMVAVGAGSSIAYEVYMRGLNPPGIAFGILGGWALGCAFAADGRRHRVVIGVCAALTLIGLPAAIMREAWHGRLGDSFTTTVPADDLAVLTALREQTPRDAMVWQYPESGLLAAEPGRDVWAPIFAGRALVASGRATNMAAAEEMAALQRRYFAGENVPIPARVDAVYLSRTLHPLSYDALVASLRDNPAWIARDCPASACLYLRKPPPL